ncbi:hypothetical protein M422DRAFT_272586 [Sphaerobolus stellatus SS14]|uniref:Uncharacterized protein n=1 Tax=Sphaerobolus stellatus (strain SS14) TaxID=990650 RepID=A0A0C9UB87_SPHS4|nr:hypothetical protein M422DRAFT_272586 [Sphaerobolus stellatus SS14]
MVEENPLLSPEQVYVCSAEKVDIPREGSFSPIICMFKAMTVVVAHAFTTSQSAKAHKVLFQRIFAIVEADTGQQVQHIHGTGWDTIITDEHHGLAIVLWVAPNHFMSLHHMTMQSSAFVFVSSTTPPMSVI